MQLLHLAVLNKCLFYHKHLKLSELSVQRVIGSNVEEV